MPLFHDRWNADEPNKETNLIALYEDGVGSDRQGTLLGHSSWISMDQGRVSAFGKVTDDMDKFHVDPEWSRVNSPYGGTISFGFLTLSMLTRMLNELVARPADERATLNYGFDRVRLLSPVPVGKRIRGVFSLKRLELRTPVQYLAVFDVVVEIEDEDKPAMVADWLVLTEVERPRSLPAISA